MDRAADRDEGEDEGDKANNKTTAESNRDTHTPRVKPMAHCRHAESRLPDT